MGDDATRSHAACKATLAGVPCALEEGHRGRHRIADNHRSPCHCGFYHSSADPAYDLTGHREPHATGSRAAKPGTRVLAQYWAQRDLSFGEASAIERAMLRAALIEDQRLVMLRSTTDE